MAPPSPTTRQALAPMAEKSLNIPEFKQRLSDMKSPKSAAVKSTVQHESSSPIGAALVAIKLQRAAQALKAQQTAPSSTTKTSLIGAKLDELRFQHPDPAATAVPLGLQDKRNALSTAPVCSVGPSSEFRDAVNKSRAERLDIASMKTRDGDNEDMQAQLQFAGAFIDNIIGSVAYDLYGQNGAATTASASPVMDAPRADAKIRPWNSSALNAPRMPGKRSTYNRWIWSPSMGISQEDKWRLCGLSATECGSLQSVIAANDQQQLPRVMKLCSSLDPDPEPVAAPADMPQPASAQGKSSEFRQAFDQLRQQRLNRAKCEGASSDPAATQPNEPLMEAAQVERESLPAREPSPRGGRCIVM